MTGNNKRVRWLSSLLSRPVGYAFRRRRWPKSFNRGGVWAAIRQARLSRGAYTISGNPEKPVLMVKGSERGFALLPGVTVNPH